MEATVKTSESWMYKMVPESPEERAGAAELTGMFLCTSDPESPDGCDGSFFEGAFVAGSYDEIQARARLIAAAPDMEEAGKRVLNYATLDEILSDETRHDDSVFAIRIGDLRALRAAISKATGA